MQACRGLRNGFMISALLWILIALAIVALSGRANSSSPAIANLPSTPEAIVACVAQALGAPPPYELPHIEYVSAEKVAWYRPDADAVYLTTARGIVFLAVHDLPLLAHELAHHLQHMHGLDPSTPANEAQAAWIQTNFADLCASRSAQAG